MSEKITIGITHTDVRNEYYFAWIKGNDPNIEIIDLTAEEGNWDQIEDCDGIVLSGGVDVHPRFYDNDEMDYANAPDKFDEKRDEFEMHVFETALNFDHPILAICRGMQLVNVALGGDMIQDLEADGKQDHKRRDDEDGEHMITVHEGSLLHSVTKSITGKINTAHHQGVKNLSEELMASSLSPDGVIESIEWKEKEGEPWMLCVQWHPERMKDANNVFGKNIRESFLAEVKRKKNEGRQPSH